MVLQMDAQNVNEFKHKKYKISSFLTQTFPEKFEDSIC